MLNIATLKHRPSSSRLLARVLETPGLAEQIQALPGSVLAKLIAEVGLQDAAELVAFASTEQLAQVFEEDLWRQDRAGQDPRFDAERFVVWLEVMLEAGERFVAEQLAALPQDLVTLAFHRLLLVIPFDDLRAELGAGDDEAEAAEKAFESCLSEELDEYQLIWRGQDGWDSVLSALLAFDRDHHALAMELLERCAHLSREHIEDNGGLYEVLSAEDMLESDLSAERETRRAERGHVAPSAAAAFLRQALRPASDETPFTEHDPLTRGYFRDLSRAPSPSPVMAAPRRGSQLVELLQEAGIAEPGTPRLLGAGSPERRRRREPLVIAALRELARSSPATFAERSEELAYLSNVLVAGATVAGRRLRPVEAVEHAIDSVSLGLGLAVDAQAADAGGIARALAQHPCDGLFRLALRRAAEPGLESRPQIDARTLGRVRALLKTLKV
jgi:hypothetical protein